MQRSLVQKEKEGELDLSLNVPRYYIQNFISHGTINTSFFLSILNLLDKMSKRACIVSPYNDICLF